MRALNRLSAREVATITKRGWHADGGGLYLQVSKSGGKSWVFRYKRHGRAHVMGLGPTHDVPLKHARSRAQECRQKLLDGLDPMAERTRERMEARLANAMTVSFDDCAAGYIADHEASWRNRKHRQQWRHTLQTYASPVIGTLPIHKIDTALVLRVLQPIWRTKTETASRVRGRIELILDWAAARGYRGKDNPATWRGHIDKLLPAPNKVKRAQHLAALPYSQIAAFIEGLRAQDGTAARALEFTILTSARTSETRLATWGEFDLNARIWTVPGDRMKAGREHRVPLSQAAANLLVEVDPEYVFPRPRAAGPLSNMAMLQTLKRMGRSDITVHGFRSTFRDWTAEQTAYPRELAEKALAHTLNDRSEAAYQRGDMLEKRRRLMEAWAQYCDKPLRGKAPVTEIHRKHPESIFIEQFIFHVEKGLIAGKSGDLRKNGPDTSGTPVLARTTEALRNILNGADPDDALGITRNEGASRDRFLDPVADGSTTQARTASSEK